MLHFWCFAQVSDISRRSTLPVSVAADDRRFRCDPGWAIRPETAVSSSRQCSARNPFANSTYSYIVVKIRSPLPLRTHGNRRRVARHGPRGVARPGNTWTPGCSRSVIGSCRRSLGRSGQIEHGDLLDDRVLLSNSQHDQVVEHRELSIVECRTGSNGVHPGRQLLQARGLSVDSDHGFTPRGAADDCQMLIHRPVNSWN